MLISVTLLVCLISVCGAWIWQRRKFLRHLQHVEQIIDDVAAGRRSTSFVFRKTRDFSGLALRLEHLSDEHELLKKEVGEKKFNLDAVLASMAEGVLVVGDAHVIRMVNDSFCKMFQLPAKPLGQTILHATRAAAVDEIIREALEHGAVRSREIVVTTPNSGDRHFNVNAVPLKGTAAENTGVVAVFHDISRLRQLEEVRRDFVANVSHELRTPLSILHGYLENLIENPSLPKAERAQILQIMSKHSHRLNALLEDLLTLARLESRRDTLDSREILLEPFVKTLVREWSPKLSDKHAAVNVEIAPDLKVRADVFRLEQVLSNLLDNALKFSRDPGVIAIQASAEEADAAVEMRVEDDGIGIPKLDLPHIFERFYRVEKTRTRDAGGTGLGLSIVKHIVGLHGGTVRAESVLGRGTAIVLRFPQNGANGKDAQKP